MSQAPKDSRTPAEKARDTAGIIGSFKHEGYVPNPEDESIHERAERGEITTEEAIAIFRQRALEREQKLWRAAVDNLAEAYEYWRQPVARAAERPDTQLEVALLPTRGGIVTELKTPLDERALDRLMLGTDAAVASYQEQGLKPQAARKVRDNGPRTDLAQTQTGEDSEIA
jgi:hypothetical protein